MIALDSRPEQTVGSIFPSESRHDSAIVSTLAVAVAERFGFQVDSTRWDVLPEPDGHGVRWRFSWHQGPHHWNLFFGITTDPGVTTIPALFQAFDPEEELAIITSHLNAGKAVYLLHVREGGSPCLNS